MSANEIQTKWPIEDQTTEWKRTLSELREGLEALCGMINTDLGKGTVVFGIGPKGDVCGIEPGDIDSAQKSVTDTVGKRFSPRLLHNVEIVECGRAHLLILSACRNREVPYHECKDTAYIREGSCRRAMTDEEKASLRQRRSRELHRGPWRCDRCGRHVGMLMQTVITDRGIVPSYKCFCGGEFWPA